MKKKNDFSKKAQKRLSQTCLTIMSITEFEFWLPKQYFWDLDLLLCGYNISNLFTVCPCMNKFSV